MTTVVPFQVFPTVGTPLYRQLMDQVRHLLASGALRAGDLLPSVRQVAQQLDINPMTVSKAYSLLEREGVIEHRRGHGMVLRAPRHASESVRKRQEALAPFAQQLAAAAFQLSLTRKQVWETLEPLLKEPTT